VIPADAAAAIETKASFDVARIQAIEAEVKHDVIAFTTAVAESLKAQGLDAESRWLHYGLTSNDIVDTAQALQVKEASTLIRGALDAFLEVLKRRAIEFKHTPTIGRTHGIHAEPTTFGLKLLNWFAEMERNLIRFDAAAEDMRVGKLSGAVGTFGHLKPEHEERICARLGLKAAPVATQVIQRDRHAAYISVLALIGSTLDKIATEVRHLQRTEVREAQEYFSEKQKGSSAMPHKKNPITSEQISGLARVLRSNAQAAFENIPLWHERDISHSSVERIIFPDSTILTHYLLTKTASLIDRLLVYPARMLRNLESTGGLIFSGQLLLDLAEAGMMREDAYRLVQGHAMRAWKEDLVFRDEVARDAEINALLSDERLAKTFDMSRQLGNVDAIFARVLGREVTA
jgi:adenylosuccinate lyase